VSGLGLIFKLLSPSSTRAYGGLEENLAHGAHFHAQLLIRCTLALAPCRKLQIGDNPLKHTYITLLKLSCAGVSPMDYRCEDRRRNWRIDTTLVPLIGLDSLFQKTPIITPQK
jgi:hypothetical protein